MPTCGLWLVVYGLCTVVFIYNGQRISNLTVEAPLTSEMAMQVGLDFTLLAGSQQPLGVMRTKFTHAWVPWVMC